jgi:hypothetical protein
LKQLANDRNFTIFGVDLTKMSKPKVMLNLATMLNQGKVRLINHAEQIRQLKALQKTVTPSGHIAIAAPPGDHDDYATTVALLSHLALQLPAITPVEAAAAKSSKNPDGDWSRAVTLQRHREKFDAKVAAGDPDAVAALEWTEYLHALADDQTLPRPPVPTR